MKFLKLFLVFLSSKFSFGLEIIGILPFDIRSHYIFGNSIMTTLAEFMHNVTVVSPYPQKQELYFYEAIKIESKKYQEYANFPSFLNLNILEIVPNLKFLYQSGEDSINNVMNSKDFIQVVQSGKKFDVCVIENTHSEALMGLAEVFECILITFTTYPAVYLTDRMTSNISPVSYVPNSLLPYTHKMTFTDRLHNAFSSIIEKIFYEIYHLPNQRRLYYKYFKNARHPFDNVYRNSSIIFMNQNPIVSSPRPFMPNMIQIGGIHVQQSEPLRQNLQKFLDNAKDGVILFTMGSFIKSTDFENHQREAFIKAFSKLKQTILWKYESETMSNKPANIKIMKWLPQRDILAHPNVKLFITHGGLLGTYEALISGVPILGIPQFGDQKMNVANAVLHGNGLKLENEELSEQKISEALDKLLNDSKYKEHAEKLAEIYKDRAIPAKVQVVYWTEYVAKHKGAIHLRTDLNHLNLLQQYSIDVYAALVIILVLIVYINYRILKFLYSKICTKRATFKPKSD